ncbi:nuclease, partial [Escherichia coli]|nr:nuclease [Escherichia coli]
MKTFQLKTLSVFLSALGAFSYSSVAQAQLMFSQYVDGSNNKKGLEIYNPDGTT